MNNVLECRQLHRHFTIGPQKVSVLRALDLEVTKGELISIVGASGSGKTTLLNLLAGLDEPDSGQVLVAGKPFSELSDVQKGRVRNSSVGFVFQFHHLLPEFTALENLLLPYWLSKDVNQKAEQRAKELLDRIGLGNRYHHKPSELSGGERQRVAIARALINQPELVLMDEPTGNLDEETAEQIQQLIIELNREFETTFIVVTHSTELAKRMNKVYRLKEGQLHLES